MTGIEGVSAGVSASCACSGLDVKGVRREALVTGGACACALDDERCPPDAVIYADGLLGPMAPDGALGVWSGGGIAIA